MVTTLEHGRMMAMQVVNKVRTGAEVGSDSPVHVEFKDGMQK